MTEFKELDLSEVDIEGLADVKNLPNDLVRQVEHLLAQASIGSFFTVAANEQRCKLKAHTD